jgi:HlyD family secretion protein
MKKIIFIMSIATIVSACSNDNDWDATGTFETTEVVVSAKGSGEIKSLNIEEGQKVEANVQLGYLDMTQLEIQKAQFDANQLNLDATKAGLDANKAQLDASKKQMNSNKEQIGANQMSNIDRSLDLEKQVASIKQQIANLKKEKARFSNMVKDNAAAPKQVDDINYQILVLEKQLGATQEQIASNNKSFNSQNKGFDAQKKGVDAQIEGFDAQKRGIDAQKRGIDAQKQGIDAQKALVDNQMQNAIISSPVNGTILTKYAQRGEFATTGKPLFKVADMSTVYLRAYFTSDQLADIKLGQQVKVIADFGGGKTREYTGRISWISSESEFTPKSIQTKDTRANLVYAVKIAVRNDGYLKLGLSGNVKLK